MAMKYVLLFLMTLSKVQSDPLADREEQEKDFIIPKSVSNNVDLFVYKSEIDYIISSNELGWEEAKYSCMTLSWTQGILAIVDTQEKIEFLSEALAETNKVFDNLWVAGRLLKDGNWSTGYYMNGQIHYLPSELLDKYNGTKDRVARNVKRNCLSFRRLNHDNASYVDLNCFVQRPYICQMAHDNTTTSNVSSSHPGWIRIQDRLYKIFYDKVSWENATINCFKIDTSAKLATIQDFSTARSLGRYLLVGRPSLENAWIGAKWSFEHNLYTFVHEGIILPNETDSETNYPPWRNTVIKTGGCLLLDRHLEKSTLFVEARCQRLRPYICHKPLTTSSGPGDNNTFIFPEGDFRLHYNKLIFTEAVAACTYPFGDNPGKLAQPKDVEMIKEMLFMMGENKAYVQHIWIGGKYFDGKWKWLKQKEDASEPDEGDEDIPDKEDEYPPWVTNTTYSDDVENMNICLNMDRENHLDALFYGADCYYAQSFICQYPPGTIKSGNKSGGKSTEAITTITTVKEKEVTTEAEEKHESKEEEKHESKEEEKHESKEEEKHESQEEEKKEEEEEEEADEGVTEENVSTQKPTKAQRKKKNKQKFHSASQ